MNLDQTQTERLVACKIRTKQQLQALSNSKDMSPEHLRLALHKTVSLFDELQDILLQGQTRT